MAPPKTPLITVDIIIRPQRETGCILLIERRHSPSGWALPGGFVDAGESLEAAAVREAKEETGLNVELELLLGCYSNPNRDPRGPTVSATYVANAQGEPTAADDAKDAKFADPADQYLNLAFDHRLILDDYLRYIKTGEVAPLRNCRRGARH